MASRSAAGATMALGPVLRGWIAVGTNTSRSSASASIASLATNRWPTWGGSNVPPKMPSFRDPCRRRSGPGRLDACCRHPAPVAHLAVLGVLGAQLGADIVGIVAVLDLPIGVDQPERGRAGRARRRVVLPHVLEIDDRRIVGAALHVVVAGAVVLDGKPLLQ